MKTGIFVLFLLIIPLVLAAGGGGGGGSPARAAYSDLTCNDAGRISFSRAPSFNQVVIEKPDGSVIENVPGKWGKGTFNSDEALFKESGKYIVKDPLHGRKEVTCPGFKFSCSLVELNLNKCVKVNDNVQVQFSLTGEGAKTEGLMFKFKKKFGNLNYEWSSKKEGFEQKDDSNGLFSLNFKSEDELESVQLSYPGCVGEYYVFSKMDCTDGAVVKDGQELKCGGLMDIEDRVKCRLNLRKDQKDEYENFFPEYCLAEEKEEQEECIKLYRSVQGCWKETPGKNRDACFRKQLTFGQVIQEKEACNGLAGKEKGQCIANLKNNLDRLILLRFYSLEEEAERLMEQGKLTQEEAVDFTVKIENMKVEYDHAENKGIKKKIIQKVRKEWLNLVRQFLK